jgi:hypothetical protein
MEEEALLDTTLALTLVKIKALISRRCHVVLLLDKDGCKQHTLVS